MSDQDEPDGLAPFRQTLADLLATLRLEARLTQQHVADRIGYSPATVEQHQSRSLPATVEAVRLDVPRP